MPCITDQCRCGRAPCPTPEQCDVDDLYTPEDCELAATLAWLAVVLLAVASASILI